MLQHVDGPRIERRLSWTLSRVARVGHDPQGFRPKMMMTATLGRTALGIVMVVALDTTTDAMGATGTSERHDAQARIAPEEHAARLVEQHDTYAAAEPFRAHFGRTDLYIPTF